jgi:hypothetical protein
MRKTESGQARHRTTKLVTIFNPEPHNLARYAVFWRGLVSSLRFFDDQSSAIVAGSRLLKRSPVYYLLLCDDNHAKAPLESIL